MKTRVLSGLIMAPLIVFLIFRGMFLYAGCLLLSLMALYEFFRGFRELNIKPSYPIAAISAFALYLLGLLRHMGAMPLYGDGRFALFNSPEWVMLWLFLTVLACLLYLFKIEERKLDDAMVTLMGIVYIPFFMYHLGALGLMENYGIFVWLVVITAFGTDICAYFAGVCLGRHKLCPVISPKKTWEGAVGGVLGSVILCGVFGFFAVPDYLVHCLVIGLLGSVISMFGDLTASIFKRKMGIKDYGNLIPGHGGILDRFDSILFTAPVIYFYVVFVFERVVC